MTERHEETLAELRELLCDIQTSADQTVYGYICVENPNDFSPDPECSSEEERARHKAACKAWDKTGKNPHPAPHCAYMNGGKEPPGFGLGTNSCHDDVVLDWAEQLERCIARLEQE